GALGISSHAAHSALGDAHITAQVLDALMHFLKNKGVRTLEDLIEAQGGPIFWPHSSWEYLPGILQEALLHRRELWLRYVDGSGAITERRVEPLDANAGYLIAYCHLRRAQRVFRLDRILAMWF
ncbi:MAG: WYL domain-containing protein, partial [Anaerolineae bacterium]|nr:WYL domain-containing protein [Anaerolineae bacterium]MDW8072572.1 WYL domain-containing protein [Anaerolineae bacterium]